jgi:hypothetical protein
MYIWVEGVYGSPSSARLPELYSASSCQNTVLLT